eukprot:TRINITY_DN4266_c0_g1_i1.p2 TRINITY_DN4266_c0_g1~~TRINITY_DN4266_c0_g1_i1.p2  ORF type:complete len:87 (-),score=15.50 TRINITY_DN4266_c0_g1_i1:218-478(-)
MCLMEMIFQRASNDRNIRFSEIAETCRLPEDKVELLLMKAMSLELIEGKIGEVDKIVQVKWVTRKNFGYRSNRANERSTGSLGSKR